MNMFIFSQTELIKAPFCPDSTASFIASFFFSEFTVTNFFRIAGSSEKSFDIDINVRSD